MPPNISKGIRAGRWFFLLEGGGSFGKLYELYDLKKIATILLSPSNSIRHKIDIFLLQKVFF